MSRRARKSPHFGFLLGGLVVAIALVVLGGYFLSSSGQPYRTAAEFPAEQYLEESSSLRGNTYRLSGIVKNSILWQPHVGRLISLEIKGATSPIPLVIPANISDVNIQKDQHFDFLVEIRENGVLYATSLTKS